MKIVFGELKYFHDKFLLILIYRLTLYLSTLLTDPSYRLITNLIYVTINLSIYLFISYLIFVEPGDFKDDFLHFTLHHIPNKFLPSEFLPIYLSNFYLTFVDP